jgi:SSS family solute:Na+ symporter
MVTDCVEGLLSHLIYIATVVAVFFVVSWRQVVEVMAAGAPGHSGLNPFDAQEVEDFNFWFVVMESVSTTSIGRSKIFCGVRSAWS